MGVGTAQTRSGAREGVIISQDGVPRGQGRRLSFCGRHRCRDAFLVPNWAVCRSCSSESLPRPGEEGPWEDPGRGKLLHNHTEVNRTDLLRGCNGKGRTHKYKEKAEAAADPTPHHLSAILGPTEQESEQESEHASSCSYQWTGSTSDQAPRAGTQKANWMNEFPY